jgi:hypothetical protein
MKKIPMLERFAAQSLVEYDGELIFSKEKFAELIVRECLEACSRANEIRHFVPPTQEQVVLSCMREIETTFRS